MRWALLLVALPAWGVTTNVSSCAQATVQAAITAAAAGDILVLPTCNVTWTTTTAMTASVILNKAVTLQGATTCTGRADTLSCTDGTIINDGTGTAFDEVPLEISVSSARLTGFTFFDTRAVSDSQAAVITDKGTTGWRIDHNHFHPTNTNNTRAISAYGFGLIDHNQIQQALNGVDIEGGQSGDTTYPGDASWTQAMSFGTANAVYIEDNQFTYTSPLDGAFDAYAGARFVFRYNYVSGTQIGGHGLDSGGLRSVIQAEVYNNTFTNPNTAIYTMGNTRGGSWLLWNNTILSAGGSFNSFWWVQNYRSDSACGAECGSWGVCDGTNALDQNTTGQQGWACRDQVGRGTNQASYPQYTWGNAYKGAPPTVASNFYICGYQDCTRAAAYHLIQNRDFYNEVSPFTGATGVGFGTLSSRPTTCTAGVAYFATDQAPQGVLYQCGSGSTWPTYYTPYTYPHPLQNATPVAPTITSASPLPGGTVGTAYNLQFVASGTAPITWSATGAPAGLTLSSTGLLSGTPTTAAASTINVTASNTAGTAGPLGFSITISPSSGNTYYVATTGSNSNTCAQAQSSTTPKLWVSQGVACAQNPGDVVMIAAGTYGNEGVTGNGTICGSGCASPVTLTWGGSSSAPITIRGANPASPAVLDCQMVINQPTTGCDMYIFLASGANYWTFQYLRFTNSAAQGIETTAGASYISILNCEIDHIGNWNTAIGYGMGGIYADASATNWTVDSSSFHDIGRTGGLSNNQLDHGIYSGVNGSIVTNSVFYNLSKGSSIQIHNGQNWKIYNNTFAFNPAQPYAGHLNFWGTIPNITVRNNIFFQAGAQVIDTYQVTMSNCLVDTNVVYPATALFNSQPATCTVSNISNGNPNFTNTATAPYDFHVSPPSSAIDAGVNNAVTAHDFAGTSRPQPAGGTYDIGAYEYQPATPCVISPTVLGPWTSTQVINQTLTETGCTGNWGLTGSWPAGLSGCNTGTLATCTVTGTISGAGTFSPTVTYGTASNPYSITVNPAPAITTTILPGGLVSISYSQTLLTTGGTGALACTLASGSLPTNLTLSPGCIISGTPTVAGTSNFTVNATDGNGISTTQALSLTVGTASPTQGTTIGGQCGGCRF